MSVENLDKIFQPKSIAVVGASERKGIVGAVLMRNLLEYGFSGEIHPINPNHKKIGKLPAWPSIRDLKAPVDLAVIATPTRSAPQIVKECVDLGRSNPNLPARGLRLSPTPAVLELWRPTLWPIMAMNRPP
jgi:acetyltransferase